MDGLGIQLQDDKIQHQTFLNRMFIPWFKHSNVLSKCVHSFFRLKINNRIQYEINIVQKKIIVTVLLFDTGV